MTSKSKNAVRLYETEIEKCREESNWKKAVELALQLKARSPQHESLAHFLIGEGKLEAHLDEYPPLKENIEKAQRELSEAKGFLTLATDESGKKAGVALDAHLLLGKLNYACGAYEDALKHYKLAELSTLTEKELPIRSLRIVAESYAIKGLCLEQIGNTGSSSRFKQAEKEAEMINSYTVSAQLTVLYVQRAAAAPPLATALLRAPALLVRAGRTGDALERYREMFRAVECQWTQSFRLTIATQLAELLMRGHVGQVYKPPEKSSFGTLNRKKDDQDGPWKPKKYSAANQFVPTCPEEETLLVLLVGEALSVRGGVLSQSPEFHTEREAALARAAHHVGLLARGLLRWGRRGLLVESLERLMKFSFGCAHVWRLRALAAAAAGGGGGGSTVDLSDGYIAPPAPPTAPPAGVARAAAVLRHTRPLVPHDGALRLVGARGTLAAGQIDEAIMLAEEAVRIEEANDGPFLARCYLYAGIAYQMKAQRSPSHSERARCAATSGTLLRQSLTRDPADHLGHYHMGLHYADGGMLDEALDSAVRALRLYAGSCGALRLAATLQARVPPRAAALALRAAAARPAALWPRAALARVRARGGQAEAALSSAKELLTLLNSQSDVEILENGLSELDALSDSQHEDIHSSRDAASLAETVCRGETEGARGTARAAVWLLLAELCLRLGRISVAAGCVSEAATLTPYNYMVLYTRGLVHEASNEWEEAKECYRNAVALNPTHVESLVHLGTAHYTLGWPTLGEQWLRQAATLRPRTPDVWRRLAAVLRARGDHVAAADAAAAALQYGRR